ncbi:MAG: gliding motility-associated C-terminal domain-containing protein [Bacteroidia bacterium]|nr:gliding motility-associated C-terminal domain-containing protein [Bacteroidia bacterium]MBP9688315.1 gliding motility-associated C-terminal domain-containing protein [Bacteroidia bacterium]
MKKLLFVLIWNCITLLAQAQQINEGIAYGGVGEQHAMQCFIDKVGNRYQVIAYTDSFSVDSAGYPILIKQTHSFIMGLGRELVIVKYDTNDRYLYYIRLYGTSSSRIIDIKFTSTNDVIFCFGATDRDTVVLIDAKGVLFRTVTFDHNKNKFDFRRHPATLLCKLSSDGQYIWANTIGRETLIETDLAFCEGITLNKTDEIRLYFPNVRIDTLPFNDTLIVTNNAGQKSLFFVRSAYVLFKFSSSGALLAVKEPLKNMFTHHQQDTINFRRACNIVTDGDNTYATFRFRISNPDTFKTNVPIPLNVGIYSLLVKLNTQDSVMWAKPIIRELDLRAYYYPPNHLNFDTIRQELLFSAPFDGLYYDFLLDPTVPYNSLGSYLCKFNTNGDIINHKIISGYDANITINSLTPNYVSGHTVLVGYTNGYDAELQKFLPANTAGLPTVYIAYLDSLLNVISAQHIITDYNYFEKRIILNPYNIGYPITDYKGRTFISGGFIDSINLLCRTLNANIEQKQYRYLHDAFVLRVSPILYKDTSVCYNMVSPSNKFTWDSTAIYIDTIANQLGCDSILYYKVRVLRTKSELDSTVCKPMVSFSHKYIWDTTSVYFDTIPNAVGCDSIIKLTLTTTTSKATIDTTVSSQLISPSTKFVWNSSGVYNDTLTNVFGCDSLLIINLTVLQNNSNIDTAVCRFLHLAGSKYTFSQSGNFIDTLTNVAGGDSIISITLKILQSSSTKDTAFCGKILSPSGLYWWGVSGIYLDTIPNVFGCDSIITTNFTKTNIRDSIQLSFCRPLQSPSGKFWMNTNGFYTDTLVGYQSCDSIITINFTKTNIRDSIQLSFCGPLQSPSGKFWMNTNGFYTDTLVGYQGCDSVVDIAFKLLQSFSTINKVACDSFESPSKKFNYTIAGIYNDTIINTSGCDSVITINLSFSTTTIQVTKSNDIDCNLQLAQLTVSDGELFSWTPIDGLSDASVDNPFASPNKTTLYTVLVTDTNGCKYMDTITIVVYKNDSVTTMPNVFTPNNDGVNDCISAAAMAQFYSCEFVIFTRWGDVIWETNNTNACWDGKYNNGQNATDGVYYYTLKGTTPCQTKVNSSGTITIVR